MSSRSGLSALFFAGALSALAAGCVGKNPLVDTWSVRGVTTLGGLNGVFQDMTLGLDGSVSVLFQGTMGSAGGTREGCVLSVRGTGMTWTATSTNGGTSGTITFAGTATAMSQMTNCPNTADNHPWMSDPNQVTLVSVIAGTHTFGIVEPILTITYSNPGMTAVTYSHTNGIR